VAVQRIEAEFRFPLGLVAQFLSQGREFRPRVRFRSLGVSRSRLFQSALLLSYRYVFEVGSLGSTGITPLLGYYGPLRLPTQPPDGYVFPTGVDDITATTPGLPGSSIGLSPRAVPSHPGSPNGCIRSLLHHRRRASPLAEGWPNSKSLTRPKRVHAYALRPVGSRMRSFDLPITLQPSALLLVERAITRQPPCRLQDRPGLSWRTAMTCNRPLHQMNGCEDKTCNRI